MKRSKNGLYWTNDCWSHKHVLSESEDRDFNVWFYENILPNNQQDLSLERFNTTKIIFEKGIIGRNLAKHFIYSEEKSFHKNPKEINEILKSVLIEFGKSLEAIWYVGYQSNDTFIHDLATIGTYSFEKQNDEALYPIFHYLLDKGCGQEVQYNDKLFSGLVGDDKDWCLLLTFDYENKKEFSIRMAGDINFCNSIVNKIG